jgi:hypothetical protein
MICPLLTHTDMQTAMTEPTEVFQLQIVWLGDAVVEIRWNGGMGVAQTDQVASSVEIDHRLHAPPRPHRPGRNPPPPRL